VIIGLLLFTPNPHYPRIVILWEVFSDMELALYSRYQQITS